MRNTVCSVERIVGSASYLTSAFCMSGHILCLSVKRSSAANSSVLNFCWCLPLRWETGGQRMCVPVVMVFLNRWQNDKRTTYVLHCKHFLLSDLADWQFPDKTSEGIQSLRKNLTLENKGLSKRLFACLPLKIKKWVLSTKRCYFWTQLWRTDRLYQFGGWYLLSASYSSFFEDFVIWLILNPVLFQ